MFWKSKEKTTETLRMVVGLGNPGSDYSGTRHNIGFEVVDELARRLMIDTGKKKFTASYGEGRFADYKLILLKPMTFMNRSGQSVATAAGFFKISPQRILVVFDDMALEPGVLRIRKQGSAGGHNGLADIIQKLGTDDVPRLRVGIGQASGNAVGHVLGKFEECEKPVVHEAVRKAADAVEMWLDKGLDAAMNEFNIRQKQ